jgi:hypothetical protein
LKQCNIDAPGIKSKTKDPIMRLLTLTTVLALAITGTAMAKEKHSHHPVNDANASIVSDGVPADSMSAHESHIVNLRDSGYDPRNDFTASGTIKQN